jgi:hypothetical protein
MDLLSAFRGSRLKRLVHRFGKHEDGNYAVVTALALPALLGMGGLGTEVGFWMYTQQAAQGAADVAAFSAAIAYSSGKTDLASLTAEAKGVAASYNPAFVDGTNGVTVTVYYPPHDGNHKTVSGAVEVSITQSLHRMLSAAVPGFGSGSTLVKAYAVAIPNVGPCLVALATTGSGTVSMSGSTHIDLSGCDLYDNSSSSSAVSLGGSSTMSAYQVNVVGGVSGSSSITTTATPGIQTSQPAISDPYANYSYGSYSSMSCVTQPPMSGSSQTLSPGRYCSGISASSGNTVTLSPGIYYLDGSSSGITMAGNATLQGDGVTLVFSGSSSSGWAGAKIASNATINLNAPSTGSTAGIVIFGDRNMPTSGGSAPNFNLTGGGTQIFGGAIYLPKGNLSFSGGSSTGTKCTQIVAYTVSFVGNSNLAMNCSGYGVASSMKAILVD